MIRVVDNAPEHYEFIRVLRNDPRVAAGFIATGEITPAQQIAYMAKHAGAYLVALRDGVPAGYAGSIDGDIRVCVHPDHQGHGVGKALIEAVLRRYPGSFAKIKVGNEASMALFASCGFKTRYVIMEPDGPAK